jgi:dihydroflavonol-4-reductase
MTDDAGTAEPTPKPPRKRASTRKRAEPPAAAEAAPSPEAAPTDESAHQKRRIVLTGGAGFVGGAVARLLRERGDDLVAIVRDRHRAAALVELGVEIIEDDLSDVGRMTEALRGAEAVIHAAGSYRIGIPKSERGAMWDANVGATTRLLDAAEAAKTPRTVYVSTVNVFGNTRGRIVDETYRRDLADGFLSWYDETKYGAHEVAEQRIAGGAPIVVVLPSQVYGPGDHSAFGEQLAGAFRGKLPYRSLDDVGVGLIHADDLAAGIVAALDRGEIGRQYVLSGPTTTLAEAIDLAAKVGGRKPPRLRLPTGLLRALAPLGSVIGRPNLREVVAGSAGVTYWASAARAETELGFHARPIEAGLGDTFATA